MKNDAFVVSCEHGGNRIPSRYRPLFEAYEALLPTHRGHDAGALRLARELSAALHASLFVSTVSRLLVDLNRSIGHPRLFSEATRFAPQATRQQIIDNYYLPYRTGVQTCIAQALAHHNRIIHISCHSFTPELDGKPRVADIGLLYDPARPGELEISRRCRMALKALTPALRVRLNYPYAGTSDGLTTSLRRLFPADRYLGVELEINQQHVLRNAHHWHALRRAIIESLCAALTSEKWNPANEIQ